MIGEGLRNTRFVIDLDCRLLGFGIMFTNILADLMLTIEFNYI